MAHFAVLDKDNKVIFVTPIANEKITLNDLEVEQLGIDFLFNTVKIQTVYTDAVTAKQTSYNSNFRNKYAGVGDTYNQELNAFISPQPYPSWTLNGVNWEAPIPQPGDNYYWNEETLNWIEL
jgi:hypothetical protein